jgi:hypothetical protein
MIIHNHALTQPPQFIPVGNCSQTEVNGPQLIQIELQLFFFGECENKRIVKMN